MRGVTCQDQGHPPPHSHYTIITIPTSRQEEGEHYKEREANQTTVNRIQVFLADLYNNQAGVTLVAQIRQRSASR